MALAPLLIIKKRDDEISKRVIKEAKKFFDSEDILEFEDDYEENDEDDLINGLYQMKNNFRDFLLKDNPHIKEYRKARKIHGEIMDSMMNYFESSKYKENTEKNYMNIIKQQKNEIKQ